MMNRVDNHQGSRRLQRADSIGSLALQRIRRAPCWRILKVYRCCFYCANDQGDIICVGSGAIGRGPIAITGTALGNLTGAGLSEGEVLHAAADCLLFRNRGLAIDVNDAEIWDKLFTFCSGSNAKLERHLACLTRLAGEEAPEDSLGSLIPAICSTSIRQSPRTSDLSRLLHEKVLGVIQNARKVARQENTEIMAADLAGCLGTLIGTGFGLTPSGDDFCCGVVLGFARMQRYQLATRLAALLCRHAAGKTTVISQAYFKSLAESCVSEPQARLIACFGSSSDRSLEEVLLKTGRYGSTSGWDMLAGFAFGLVLTQRLNETAGASNHRERTC